MSCKQYNKVSTWVVRMMGYIIAVIAAYLAGNKPEYRPDTGKIARYLHLNRSVVTRALETLREMNLVVCDGEGGWSATSILIDKTSKDHFRVGIDILRDSNLCAAERLLYGYLVSSNNHSIDDIACDTGMKKSSINKYLSTLTDKGKIYKDTEGGGRGYKRHFTCVDCVSDKEDVIEVSFEVHPDEESEASDEYLLEAEEHFEGCDASVPLDMQKAAVQIVAEISATEYDKEIDVDGVLMMAPDVWELTGLMDGAMLETLAKRMRGSWGQLNNKRKQGYLRTALLREAKTYQQQMRNTPLLIE